MYDIHQHAHILISRIHACLRLCQKNRSTVAGAEQCRVRRGSKNMKQSMLLCYCSAFLQGACLRHLHNSHLKGESKSQAYSRVAGLRLTNRLPRPIRLCAFNFVFIAHCYNATKGVEGSVRILTPLKFNCSNSIYPSAFIQRPLMISTQRQRFGIPVSYMVSEKKGFPQEQRFRNFDCSITSIGCLK